VLRPESGQERRVSVLRPESGRGGSAVPLQVSEYYRALAPVRPESVTAVVRGVTSAVP
jgi:hypothetical protein